MANKQSLLMRTLLAQNRRLTASQLAGQLDVSVRTVHNYISALNDQFAGIITATDTGYQIDPVLAEQALNLKTGDIPQTAEERCNYILNRLAQTGRLNIYDLCDEIYISSTTFHSLLGRMRRLTRDHDLKLTVSAEEVSLTGSESNKRKLLSSLLYLESASAFTDIETIQAAFPSIDIGEIHRDVTEVLNEYQYYINDYSCINLLLHIAIAINRIQSGSSTDDIVEDNSALGSQEKELAARVIERLERHYQIRFSPADSYELALLLVSRATTLNYESISAENISRYIGEAHLTLVHRLIETIKEFYDIDLDEPDFFIRFALHIRNLMVRASHQSFCKNPLVAEIRQTCPLIYDVSVQLSGVILEETGISIDDDEIAYIALHIGGALEIQKELATRISAVLYCPSYYNLDSSLAERLSQKLEGKLMLTNVFTHEHDLEKLTAKTLVISTVKLHQVINHPLVVISPFLTNSDCMAISHRVDEIRTLQRKESFRDNLTKIMSPGLFERSDSHHTREQVIHYICGRLTELGYADGNYERDVLEREGISSTAFSQFAIPHTLKMRSKRTGIFVYISGQPIQWDENAVSLVIMLCFSPDDRKVFYDIFEPLTMILLDSNNLKQILNCDNFNSLIDFFVDNLE